MKKQEMREQRTEQAMSQGKQEQRQTREDERGVGGGQTLDREPALPSSCPGAPSDF